MAAKIIVVGLYVLVIIIVGLMGLRKTKSFSDFFLGGGKVGAVMSAFSYGAAYFSAVLFIGFAGKIGWSFGYSALWIAIFNALLGVLGVWAIVGWKIKKASMELGVTTLGEYLEKRYQHSFFKLLSSLVIFIFMIPYSAAVFMGLSYLFTVNFQIDYWQALTFMGVFTAFYLVLGGYKAGALMDMIFGMIMTLGVIILFVVTLQKGGGIANITEKLHAIDPKLTAVVGPPGWWPLLSLVLLTSLAPFAMPQLMQKFYAIKDRQAVRKGMFASTFFALLIGGVAYFVGSTTRVFMSPENNPTAFQDGKPIFDNLMPEMLTNVIPSSLAVVILLLILSASMSTLAALVLISSSTVVKDFYAGFINKAVSDKKLTTLMRIMSAVFVLLAVLLALVKFDVIVEILGISWGAIGSFFLGPFIWGLFLKKANFFSALAGGITGLLVCLVLYFMKFPSPEAGTLGMLISLTLVPVLSIFTKKHEVTHA
ncbi:MAG TPA: sodium:solute symporter [Bacteroidia bacterium]|nr:sodium:solute symporter [Sphingobacteriales bacterium]HPD65509.1 sodium:solute symporter [Bacteroidia bacterium]HRS59164.1 sodium:solute symporter [Bacteroidia bacterium]HRU67460.1 sodium:solute symporter [Bacteroidia bacterium]